MLSLKANRFLGIIGHTKSMHAERLFGTMNAGRLSESQILGRGIFELTGYGDKSAGQKCFRYELAVSMVCIYAGIRFSFLLLLFFKKG